jgi:hypothetical protein
MNQIEWWYVESRHVIRAESIIGRIVEGRSLAEIKNKLRGMHGQQTSQITLCGRQ